MKSTLHKLGLHPLVAFVMIAVDWMLFGADITGVGWGISCAVAIALTLPVILAQKYAYKDNWGTAIAKGFIVCIITAIPTALPSVITGISGILGIIGGNKAIDIENKNMD